MIEFHDPRGQVATEPRPYTLGIKVRGANGLTVGLLANGFPDSVNFLDRIGDVIAELEPGVSLSHYNKGNASIAAPDDMLAEIRENCDAVVAAYGH